MQFSRVFLAAAAAVGVHATVILTDPSYAGITANVPFDITWADADGAVTLVLVNDADPNNVLPIETLASMLPSAFNPVYFLDWMLTMLLV
jgi:predicted secreted protein